MGIILKVFLDNISAEDVFCCNIKHNKGIIMNSSKPFTKKLKLLTVILYTGIILTACGSTATTTSNVSTDSYTENSLGSYTEKAGLDDEDIDNSSGNTDTGQASSMTYSSTWVGRSGASISVPDHTITHESVRHKMEVPIQAGTYKGESAEIDIVYDYLDAEILGITDVNTLTRESSLEAIDKIGHAIDIVVDQRSQFGAYQNRFEHAQKINDNSAENTEYADSVIRDTGMASEMVRLS